LPLDCLIVHTFENIHRLTPIQDGPQSGMMTAAASFQSEFGAIEMQPHGLFAARV